MDSFRGCTSLTSVTYDADSQQESIGPNAFRGSSLASIRIPASVQIIEKYAFTDSLLVTVSYDCSNHPLFIGAASFSGTPYAANGLVMPSASCRRIEFALGASDVLDGHLIVPAASTRIDSDLFDGIAITTVTFEEGSELKVIADEAFEDSYLTSIDIPASVELIGDAAFRGSFALSSISFRCSSHSLSIAANAFAETALTSVALPPGAIYEGPVEVTVIACSTAKPSGQPTGQPSAAPSSQHTVEQPAGPVTCDAGQYLKNKGENDEACQACPAGKFTRKNGNRKKKCPRCPHGTYQPEEGQSTCLLCPEGFRSRGQRGGPNCFHKKTGRPMQPSDV